MKSMGTEPKDHSPMATASSCDSGLYTVQNGKIVKKEFFYSMSAPEVGPH
jgi:hypothetical protein